jgi:hypothetical protein
MLVFATNSLIMGTIALFIPVAVAWRYPLRDRAARLLLLGALATIADMLLNVVLYFVSDYLWTEWLMTLWRFVWIFAAAALAAGIAGRAGAVRRPPLRLAVVAVGVVFMYATIMYGYGDLQPQRFLQSLADYLSTWIVQASWVAIAWVGIAVWRRGRGSWGWKLVLAAGTLHVLALAPNFLTEIRQLLDPANSSTSHFGGFGVMTFATSDTGNFAITPEFWWQIVTSIASQAALLIALLIGLRPPAPKRVEPMLDPADAEPTDMAAPLGEQTRNPA